jgi:hypothetical protein
MPMFVARTPLSAYRNPRSLAYVAVAAAAVTVRLRGPGRHVSFFRISPIDSWDASAQQRDQNPAWPGNEKRE